jgi:hypothetical protein
MVFDQRSAYKLFHPPPLLPFTSVHLLVCVTKDIISVSLSSIGGIDECRISYGRSARGIEAGDGTVALVVVVAC